MILFNHVMFIVLCVCQLADALQEGNQARAELSLQQKLRAEVQLRVEELEESVLEKDQELLRLTQIVSRLQGEVRLTCLFKCFLKEINTVFDL